MPTFDDLMMSPGRTMGGATSVAGSRWSPPKIGKANTRTPEQQALFDSQQASENARLNSGIGGAGWGAGVNNLKQNAGTTPEVIAAYNAQFGGAPMGSAGGTTRDQIFGNGPVPTRGATNLSTPDYPTTLGGMASGASGFPTNAVTEAPGNYTGGMKLSDYLNPAADWARNEGLKAIQSSYAGAGDFLSGNAMKGISNYASNSALNSAWQPAFNNYMTDKGFNYTVDNNDRNFAYGADEDLANLGLAGTQGQTNSNSALATLLAQLAQSAGVVQGTGTMGQNSALTTAIGQSLGNYQGNDILNRILNRPAGG